MEDLAAMNRRHALIAYVLIACTLVLALIVRASETRAGSWTITHSDEPAPRAATNREKSHSR